MNKKINILVVDDNATMRKILIKILKEMGLIHIFEADDGTTARAQLMSKSIGLVISDWNMPHMSGLQLLKNMRKDDQLKKIPMIMVTAEGIQDNVVEAIRAGVNGYIVKPFDRKIIAEKIHNVLEER